MCRAAAFAMPALVWLLASLAATGSVQPDHGPISFSYNRSSWCSVGSSSPVAPQPQYWNGCAGHFTADGDNHSTPSAVVGETTYSDEHGLQVRSPSRP